MTLAGVLGIILLALLIGGASGWAASFARWRIVAREVGLLGDDLAAITVRIKKREGAAGGERRVELQRSREEAQLQLMQQAAAEKRRGPVLVQGEPPAAAVAMAFGGRAARQTIVVDE